jgi:hypothetical protein
MWLSKPTVDANADGFPYGCCMTRAGDDAERSDEEEWR